MSVCYTKHRIEPMEHLPNIIETAGTLMIAFAALRVHHRVLHDHTIDQPVMNTMRREQKVGMIGVVLVIIGLILSIVIS